MFTYGIHHGRRQIDHLLIWVHFLVLGLGSKGCSEILYGVDLCNGDDTRYNLIVLLRQWNRCGILRRCGVKCVMLSIGKDHESI